MSSLSPSDGNGLAHFPPVSSGSHLALNGKNGEGATRAFPKIAIITRTKERGSLLRRCTRSVLKQTCENWVHVIVNDGGSREALDSLMSEYADDYNGRLLVDRKRGEEIEGRVTEA
ncbi:MAG TPA: glycosyltransferase [Chthoniobacterales bacterium]